MDVERWTRVLKPTLVSFRRDWTSGFDTILCNHNTEDRGRERGERREARGEGERERRGEALGTFFLFAPLLLPPSAYLVRPSHHIFALP